MKSCPAPAIQLISLTEGLTRDLSTATTTRQGEAQKGIRVSLAVVYHLPGSPPVVDGPYGPASSADCEPVRNAPEKPDKCSANGRPEIAQRTSQFGRKFLAASVWVCSTPSKGSRQALRFSFVPFDALNAHSRRHLIESPASISLQIVPSALCHGRVPAVKRNWRSNLSGPDAGAAADRSPSETPTQGVDHEEGNADQRPAAGREPDRTNRRWSA